ncbi:MAG: succinylglutamate desuccinylase/aspartoacylase family protein [Planctomycetota bacterium]
MTTSRADRNPPIEIGGQRIRAGERRRFDLPAAWLPTRTQLHLPLTVMHGLKPGPKLWVSAAVHGDELNGVEIIARLLEQLEGPLKCGTLIAVPIVNVFGFIQQSRYLPDRRDLNRSFPGSKRGSLASRIAHLFLTEIVRRCSHGIDLHTGSADRSNYPQVRGNLDDPETHRLAAAFHAPVMLRSLIRDGSMRGAATRLGIPVIVYEGGEALRFNETAIQVGVRGVLGVMQELGLIRTRTSKKRRASVLLTSSAWIRARRGGLLRLAVDEGDSLEEGQSIGTIIDPFGEDPFVMKAPFKGLVIGKANNPVVHGGDAVVHLGRT